MKKLLFALCFLISAAATAQQYKNDTATYGIWENRIKVKNALGLPRKAGNTTNTVDTSAQIFITNNDSITVYSKGQYIVLTNTNKLIHQTDTFYQAARFVTTTRILTLTRQDGGTTNVVIPRGGSLSGMSSLSSSRSSNIITLTGDNGSTVQFDVRDADSANLMKYSDTSAMLSPYARSQAVVKYYDTSAMLSPYLKKSDTLKYAKVININALGNSLTYGIGATSLDSAYPKKASLYSGANFINNGHSGETSTQLKNRLLATTADTVNMSQVWQPFENTSDTALNVANLNAMVSFISHNRYVILGEINRVGNPVGNSEYDKITAMNANLAKKYGNHFIDIRSFLLTQGNGSAQDDSDIALGYVPRSLRSDILHLNDKGYRIVAQKIIENMNVLIGGDAIYANSINLASRTGAPIVNGNGVLVYSDSTLGGQINAYSATIPYVGGQPLTINYSGGDINLGTTLGAPSKIRTGFLPVSTLTTPKIVLRGDGTDTSRLAFLPAGGITSLAGTININSGANSTVGKNVTIDINVANNSPGLYGDSTTVPQFYVNGYGQVTGVISKPILISESQVTNLTTDLNLKLNKSDTATMLTNYLRKSDTATMLSGYLRTGNAGSGSVTSIATTNGILGGTITSTGTLQIDSSKYSTLSNLERNYVPYIGANRDVQLAANSFSTTTGNILTLGGYLHIRNAGNTSQTLINAGVIQNGIVGGDLTFMGHNDFRFYQSSPNHYLDLLSRNLTADRIVYFPNRSFTVADSADVIIPTESTFTVTLTPGTSGSITLSNNTLRYIKSGNMVTITGYIDVASVSSPVGSLTLNGLPFTSGTGLSFYTTCPVYANALASSATGQIMSLMTGNSSSILLYKYIAGSLANLAQDVQAGSQFIISMTYFINYTT